MITTEALARAIEKSAEERAKICYPKSMPDERMVYKIGFGAGTNYLSPAFLLLVEALEVAQKHHQGYHSVLGERIRTALNQAAKLLADRRERIMKKQNWIWMPHAGHLCVSSRCQFHLNTYVGKYIVSTVGEWQHSDHLGFEEIGSGRLYETMVFKSTKSSKDECCPWRMTGHEVDMEGYNEPKSAYAGHLKMCNKWSKK